MSDERDKSAVSMGVLMEFVLREAQVKFYRSTLQIYEDGYRCEKRTVGNYDLLYVMRGEVIWEVGGEEVELKKGDLLTVPPGVENYGYSVTKRMTLLSMHVDVRLPGGRDVFELLVPPRIQRLEGGGRLDEYLQGAAKEFELDNEGLANLMVGGWSRLIVLEVLRSNAEKDLLEYRPLDSLVVALLEELGRRIGVRTDLNDLAKWSGYSAQHVSRVFRRALGLTPLQYLTRMRMEMAGILLAEGRLTIGGVGNAVGFDDPFYFSRLFKKHFGQSPREYQQAASVDWGG